MREEAGADTVLETAPGMNVNFELLMKYWPGRHHKYDKDQCAVYYERLGAVGTQQKVFALLRRWFTRSCSVQMCAVCSTRCPRRISSMCISTSRSSPVHCMYRTQEKQLLLVRTLTDHEMHF